MHGKIIIYMVVEKAIQSMTKLAPQCELCIAVIGKKPCFGMNC